jgi:hypothetical protein
VALSTERVREYRKRFDTLHCGEKTICSQVSDQEQRRRCGYDNNTALHYTCRWAKHEMITLLLEGMMSYRCRNGMLRRSFLLLWENEVIDRDRVTYKERAFRH